jgi:hypothetical protein
MTGVSLYRALHAHAPFVHQQMLSEEFKIAEQYAATLKVLNEETVGEGKKDLGRFIEEFQSRLALTKKHRIDYFHDDKKILQNRLTYPAERLPPKKKEALQKGFDYLFEQPRDVITDFRTAFEYRVNHGDHLPEHGYCTSCCGLEGAIISAVQYTNLGFGQDSFEKLQKSPRSAEFEEQFQTAITNILRNAEGSFARFIDHAEDKTGIVLHKIEIPKLGNVLLERFQVYASMFNVGLWPD